jgi:2-dehydropantoate 2-reductase
MGTESQRTYAVIGTGAVGGFYGARLARAGVEVHFLLHSDYEHVRDHGLVVESVDGDFELPQVNAYGRAEDVPACDVVLLALKTTQNHLLAELLAPAAGQRGVVLVLQNGLGIEDHVAEIVGPDRVMGGLCFLCSNKVGPGRIRHLDYGWITLGDYCPDGRPMGLTQRLRGIQGDFERAGIEVRPAGDLLLERWKKLIWNVPYNGLSVVLDATTAELMAGAHTRRLVEQIMVEVAVAARACGKDIEDDFIRDMLSVTVEMAPYRTSMKIDHDEGKPMEIEAIFGAPLRAARGCGVSCPRTETLYRQLKFLDARNRGTGGGTS